MNYNDCILFLRNNQPLPPTDSISEDTLNYFNKVLEYLQIKPSIESIPLLLNCFGEGDGHGVYSMIENIIAMHPKETVIPYLLQALNNKKGSIKFWCAEIAASFPDPILFPHLRDIYLNGNEDERDAALFSISLINSNQSIEFLNKIKKDQKKYKLFSCPFTGPGQNKINMLEGERMTQDEAEAIAIAELRQRKTRIRWSGLEPPI